MLTVCPYPDCRITYEANVSPDAKHTNCPQCSRTGAIRSPEAWHHMSLKKEKISSENHIPSVHKFTAIVEDVRSLWNVGSIFRTADAAGVSCLYLCGITGCPPRNEIAKTSLGAEDYVLWEYFSHPLDVIPSLREIGVTIFGLERTKTSKSLKTYLNDKTIHKPVCLVIGNEVHGISPETLSFCDYVGELPMKGHKESLNVAVAFGIATYLINELL